MIVEYHSTNCGSDLFSWFGNFLETHNVHTKPKTKNHKEITKKVKRKEKKKEDKTIRNMFKCKVKFCSLNKTVVSI